jgi:hypothetical protein
MKYGWNLDPEAWKVLSNLVSSLNWQNVPFDAIHYGIVPKEPGVYLICSKPPELKTVPFNKFFNVLYAGLSTKSIQARFLTHCKNPDEGINKAKKCFNYKTTEMSFYFATAQKEIVTDIEYKLIECFGPSCNRQAGIIAKLGVDRPAG